MGRGDANNWEPDTSWYWTGESRAEPCGCSFRELAPVDGHCEPIWMGTGPMCTEHHKQTLERVKELHAQGILPQYEEKEQG